MKIFPFFFILVTLTSHATLLLPAQVAEIANYEASSIETIKRLHLTTQTDLALWKERRNEDGVKTYLPAKGSSEKVTGARGETVVNAPLLQVISAFADLEVRKDWFDGAQEVRLLSQNPERKERIEYLIQNIPWPYHNRDFILMIRPVLARNPNQVFFIIEDADQSLVPHTGNLVRASIIREYFYMKELSPTSTLVGVETSVDPGGNIPGWITQMTSEVWPFKTLKKLAKIMPTNKSPVDPRMEIYFRSKD